ncbi:hypothetical protein ACJIZ3_017839 [Penstemon smallii]|uniref:Transcription factor Iwr1 domain-containing protein n=1 Tax=Penstemon smallii TaxID=265156 RepID=A0ABD3SWP1_9LAMI
MAESSSIATEAEKPVIVRVKRKAFQARLDAFWLEINERPLKRAALDFENLSISESSTSRGLEINDKSSKHPLADFGNLSISESSTSRVEVSKTKKILVQHLETVNSSEETFNVLRSFVPNSSDALKVKEKIEERRRFVKTVIKQDELLSKARQRQEVLSRNARFEQVWRSRKVKKEALEDESVYETCRLYDVVRVDVEERGTEVVEDNDMEDCRMMAHFLPLLQEVLPTAAKEIESDMCKQASSDGYVYDFYVVNEAANVNEVESANQFPLVKVDDEDDFYDGPDDSDYETDDSNAEDNYRNDYPDDDDDVSEDEGEVTSSSEDEISEDESITSDEELFEDLVSGSEEYHIYKESRPRDCSDDEYEMYGDGDEATYDDHDSGDEELSD